MPQAIEIVEVSPRDGLQNEAAPLATADKAGLIGRAIAAGARRLEVASFVNPKLVPQMADAEALLAMLERPPGVRFAGLVLNRRGLDRAIAAGVHEITFVIVATDTFSLRNQGCGTGEALREWRAVAGEARRAGLGVSAIIGAAFGCPF